MCGQLKVLNILQADKANDLLVQASYVGPPKKKPLTTITGMTLSLITSKCYSVQILAASCVYISLIWLNCNRAINGFCDLIGFLRGSISFMILS